MRRVQRFRKYPPLTRMMHGPEGEASVSMTPRRTERCPRLGMGMMRANPDGSWNGSFLTQEGD